jgi:hypothetical protein
MTAEEVLARAHSVCVGLLPDTASGVKSLDLEPEGLTLDALDAVLGEHRALPPMPFADRIHAYEAIAVAGARHRCTVFAAAAPDGRVSRITLRQDP